MFRVTVELDAARPHAGDELDGRVGSVTSITRTSDDENPAMAIGVAGGAVRLSASPSATKRCVVVDLHAGHQRLVWGIPLPDQQDVVRPLDRVTGEIAQVCEACPAKAQVPAGWPSTEIATW